MNSRTNSLNFYESLDECLRVEGPNVLLLSGVVHLLPHPYGFLADVVSRSFKYVIVDRTPFMRNDRDRLTVQHVPDSIYSASYPAWLLSQTRFLKIFERSYDFIANFPALDTPQPEGGKADFKGFFLKVARKLNG